MFKAKSLPQDRSFSALFSANTSHHYFNGAASLPFAYTATQYHAINAYWLADASLLAYVRDQDFVRQQCAKAQLHTTSFFEHGSTQAWISHNDTFAIVCFRGTETRELEDFFTDINLILMDDGDGHRVHTGFNHALDLVWDAMAHYLQTMLTQQPQLKIWFTGHSLGAALATLAAVRYGKAQGLYTFGSPRVGNAALGDDLNAISHRVVNNNDAVPLITLYLGYQHVGALQYIDEHGSVISQPSYWTRIKSRTWGHFKHVKHVITRWYSGKPAILFDNLNDHAPIYYAIHIWNDYIKKN